MRAFFKKRGFYFCALVLLSVVFMINASVRHDVLSSYLFKSTAFIRRSFGNLALGIQGIAKSFKSKDVLQQEIQTLQDEIMQYQKNFKSIDALLYENNRLKELLQFSLSINYTLLPSRIIANGSIQNNTRFLINKGSDSGIKKNMAVCTMYHNQLVLLGKIILVSAKNAFFISTADVNVYVPVVTNESHQQGILQGSGNASHTMLLKMDNISGTGQIFVGETLLVNEYSTVFPKGIPVGEITDVSVNEQDSLLQVQAKPYVRVNTIDTVFVIVPE